MHVNRLRTISAAVLVILALLSGSAFAADLTLQLDKDRKLATVTSSFPAEVTLLFVVDGNNRRLPLFARLSPGKSVEVPMHFEVPRTISHANCEISDPPAGLQKESDNYYHLDVQVTVVPSKAS